MVSAIFARLVRSTRGSALVEFAVIAPVLVSMLLGVVQVGMWVQNFNAVRNVTNDVARFAMVEYQRGNKINNDAIATRATLVAEGGKYAMTGGVLVPAVADRPTQVDGIKQVRLTVNYTPPEFIPFVDPGLLTISYARDIYLYDPNATA